jgi:sterol desaturase/sphingolipid hydroxylase (fatty acid hydroxylase superfamily)
MATQSPQLPGERVNILLSILSETLVLGLVFTLLLLLELLWPRDRQSTLSRLRGAVFWSIATVVNGFVAVGATLAFRAVGVRPLVVLDLSWTPLGLIAVVLIGDLFFYWMHRAQHTLLWRFHAVHHSIEELNAVSSYHHVSEGLVRAVAIGLPASLIAIHVRDVVNLGLVVSLQGAFLHSCTRLNFGPLRALVGDNVFHRIHHSREPRHFDKNFSGFCPVWDVVFGTAYFPAPGEWPATGLAEAREPLSVVDFLVRPLRSGGRSDPLAPRADGA